MATFWEKAAHSVNRMFSLLCLYVALVVFHFSFEGGTLVLIALVPGHCLLLIFLERQNAGVHVNFRVVSNNETHIGYAVCKGKDKEIK